MTNSAEEGFVTSAARFLAHRRATGSLRDFPVPRSVIFAPQKGIAEKILRPLFDQRIRGFLGEFYLLSQTNSRVGLSTNFGIGAPGIAALTDEFCALGVQQFLVIGIAGGLQASLPIGSIVLASEAIRDEGVSKHYLPDAETVQASTEMLNSLSTSLAGRKLPHSKGAVWTTDAPFRETKQQVNEYQTRGVLAVDMEAAAVFAVAVANQRSALAAFVISDSLVEGKWLLPGDSRPVREGITLLLKSAVETLS